MNLYPNPPPSRLSGIPNGMGGVRATLAEMSKLVNSFKTDAGIHLLTRQLTRGLDSYDIVGEVRVMHAFVRDRVRYIQDPDDVETLQTPQYTLRCGQGDCDDKAILMNTLLAATGKKTMFFAIGLNGQFFSHVMGGVRMGTRNIPLETILPGINPGWMHPEAGPVYTWNC